MSESKKWRVDYSGYAEPNKGLEGVCEIIGYMILALGFFAVVYTFFSKTELEPAVRSPIVKENPVELRVSDSFGGTKEEIQPSDEIG